MHAQIYQNLIYSMCGLQKKKKEKKFTQCAGFMPFDGINLNCRGYGPKIGPRCHREHE